MPRSHSYSLDWNKGVYLFTQLWVAPWICKWGSDKGDSQWCLVTCSSLQENGVVWLSHGDSTRWADRTEPLKDAEACHLEKQTQENSLGNGVSGPGEVLSRLTKGKKRPAGSHSQPGERGLLLEARSWEEAAQRLLSPWSHPLTAGTRKGQQQQANWSHVQTQSHNETCLLYQASECNTLSLVWLGWLPLVCLRWMRRKDNEEEAKESKLQPLTHGVCSSVTVYCTESGRRGIFFFLHKQRKDKLEALTSSPSCTAT